MAWHDVLEHFRVHCINKHENKLLNQDTTASPVSSFYVKLKFTACFLWPYIDRYEQGINLRNQKE